jgi:class 3 adenylate cyclase/predicted ATPase
MRCVSCGFECPEEMKFCGACGAPLQNLCPQCGVENPAIFRFCGACGTSLRLPSTAKTGEDDTLPEAERRQLTVMFADLVDSTPLAERLDPEDLRRVLHDYQEVCAYIIRRYEGYIAKYLGDGMLIYFGYPVAHEDDAWRAAQTGLGMLEAVGRLNERIQRRYGVTLQIRIGVHTGLVVAGDMGHGDQFEVRAIVGQTPNVAARLQGFAPPDTLVVSETTYRLTQGYFHCQSLGQPVLKGLSHPLGIYRVLHASTARTRLEADAHQGLTPLVGRKREVALLLDCWAQTKESCGQVVVLSGEAGIGKSRLLHVLKERVAADADAWLTECRCSAFHQNSAFYPVIEAFEQMVLNFVREDGPAERLKKLEGFLTQYGLALEESVPLLASLLSIPLPDTYAPLALTSIRQKQKTLELLVGLLLSRASKQPVLFVVDDLQWADPSTLELLELLVTKINPLPLMAVFASRPDFEFHTVSGAPLYRITLTRLPQDEIELMVERLTQSKPLPPEVLRQVVLKTDGVPLYIEEFTKMLLESEQLQEREDRYELIQVLPELAIPTTLQDSLMARLDRLGTVKLVAQLGAVLGREFRYDLLRAISPFDVESLRRGLEQLVGAKLLYQSGVFPDAVFQFKHALIQDAAYASLLKTTRQQYHQRTAQALVEQFPEEAEISPELVAHHFTAAGMVEQAIPYWQRAGQYALQHSANLEAIAHLAHGMKLLKTLPDNPERMQQELQLLTAYGSALIATRGFADPEAGHVYARAREICQQCGDSPQLFLVLWGLFTFYILRAELRTSHALCDQLLRLAEQAQRASLLLQAHSTLGANYFFLGEFVSSQFHAAQSGSYYRLEEHGPQAFLYGQDSGSVARFYLALSQWHLGYPDQALQTVREALQIAEQAHFSSTLAQMKADVALVHLLRQEWAQAAEWSALALAYAQEHAFSMWIAYATVWLGFAQTKRGQTEQGIAQLRLGLETWRSTGAELACSAFLYFIAEACGDSGQVQEGLTVLNEAEALAEKTEERWLRAEMCRLRGELLLRHTPSDELQAETCFHQALDIARGQQAKLLELRASMSLARYWFQQRRVEEARSLLAPVYGWFTEGFATADLIAARDLLEALQGSANVEAVVRMVETQSSHPSA